MVVDPDTGNGDVFLAAADSTMWLRVTHPVIAKYFAKHFQDVWHYADRRKLKQGDDVNWDRLTELRRKFGLEEAED